MIKFSRIRDLTALANDSQQAISDIVWQYESERVERAANEVWESMAASWQVMRQSVATGLASVEKSASGLVGGDANRLYKQLQGGSSLAGQSMGRAAAYALAVNEVNAAMGRIVACPTAGSCGIVPAALLAAAEELNCSDEQVIRALFTAAGIGIVIAEHASISGAQGGCQAECGSAAAMAAGAVVEMAGGSPDQVSHALALALKNTLGLVCDPVAGLVEVPCVKRNAFGAAHALLAADMALAGIASVIPADEVIDAMYQIGLALPKSLRETSEAGLAKTPTALAIEERLHGSKTERAD